MPDAPLTLNFLPVARRELLVLSKRRSTYWLRMGSALATVTLGLSVFLPGMIRGSLPTEIGALMFQALVLLALGICLAAGPVLAADSLSEEKRAGTMGLLFLTRLRGHDVVLGKLVSLGLPALYCLLAIFPVLGMSFFLGGVAAGEFLRVALALLTVLLFSLALATFVSAFCRESRHALGGTVLLLLVTCATPALLDLSPLVNGNPASASVLSLSPLAAVSFSFDVLHAVNPAVYRNSIWTTLLGSALCLTVASFWLPHSWQERVPKVSNAKTVHFSPDRLRVLRERRVKVLDRTPALWLALRNPTGRLVLWFPASVFGLIVVWFLTSLNASSAAAGLVIVLVAGSHGVYKLWVAWEASRGFIANRRSGELELLLCTPLDTRQIWQAHLAHLKRRFLAPVLLLLAADALLVVFGLRRNGWLDDSPELILPMIALTTALPVDVYAATWVGLWQSLTARSAMRATLRTVTFTFLLPGAGFLLLLGTLAFLAGSAEEALLWIVAGWFVIGSATDIGLCGYTMTKVSDSFREAAARCP